MKHAVKEYVFFIFTALAIIYSLSLFSSSQSSNSPKSFPKNFRIVSSRNSTPDEPPSELKQKINDLQNRILELQTKVNGISISTRSPTCPKCPDCPTTITNISPVAPTTKPSNVKYITKFVQQPMHAPKFTLDSLSHHFMVFIDKTMSTSKHAIHPDILLYPWDENDTNSKLVELPYRYMSKGGWRECRQACDQRKKCTAFKYEVGHQTCFLIKTAKNNKIRRMIEKWDETVFEKWAKYTTPQLLWSSKKGRFNYHQHIWGFVTKPKGKDTPDTTSSIHTRILLSEAEKETLFNACTQLGGCQTKDSSPEMTTKPTLEQDEKIFDSFKPIGDMIDTVFTTNPFGSEPFFAKRKKLRGDMGWRMCREACRSMNTIVTCVGFESYKMECKFYKAVGRITMKTPPIQRLSEAQADEYGVSKPIYGLVRSPRAGDSPTRPYVPHLPIGPDVVVNMLSKMNEKTNAKYGQHILKNTECKCKDNRKHKQGFPDIVEKCAPNEMNKMTQRYFRNDGPGKQTKSQSNQQDACMYKEVGDLIKKKDPRLLDKNSPHYDPVGVGKYIDDKFKAMHKPGKSGHEAKLLWDTYFSWPIGSCPVVAPECVSLLNAAHHINIAIDQVAYPYRKCCVEHMRLGMLAQLGTNAFEMINVQAIVVYGSLIGPMRLGGFLAPFDTDIDFRLHPCDIVPAIHFLEFILFEENFARKDKLTLLELGPHKKEVQEGVQIGHCSFFYGPKSMPTISMDSHIELYATEFHDFKYGPAVDHISWPPSHICMYGRMIPAPRQPCEFSAMVYGGNPCSTGDGLQQMLDLQPNMMGAWPKECFTDQASWNRMTRWRSIDEQSESSASNKLGNRKYTCKPGQGPAYRGAIERTLNSLEECKQLCNRYHKCKVLDYGGSSCRLYKVSGMTRGPGTSGRTLCVSS